MADTLSNSIQNSSLNNEGKAPLSDVVEQKIMEDDINYIIHNKNSLEYIKQIQQQEIEDYETGKNIQKGMSAPMRFGAGVHSASPNLIMLPHQTAGSIAGLVALGANLIGNRRVEDLALDFYETAQEQVNAVKQHVAMDVNTLPKEDRESVSFGLGSASTYFAGVGGGAKAGGWLAKKSGRDVVAWQKGGAAATGGVVEYYSGLDEARSYGGESISGANDKEVADQLLASGKAFVSSVIERYLGWGGIITIRNKNLKTKIVELLGKSASEGGGETITSLAHTGLDLAGGRIDRSQLPDEFKQAVFEGVIGSILGASVGSFDALGHKTRAYGILENSYGKFIENPAEKQLIFDEIYNAEKKISAEFLLDTFKKSPELQAKHGALYNALLQNINKVVNESQAPEFQNMSEAEKAQYVGAMAQLQADTALLEASNRNTPIDDVLTPSEVVFEDGELYLKGEHFKTPSTNVKISTKGSDNDAVIPYQQDGSKVWVADDDVETQRVSAEQSVKDSKKLPDVEGLKFNYDVDTVANRDIALQVFNEIIPENERANYIDSEGFILPAGIMRVQQAMLGKVLDDVDLLQQVISSQDQSIKDISKALTDMVGRIDGLENYTKKGKLRKGYTIKDDIKKAVRKLVKAKIEGKALSDIDMVDLTPAQQELVKSFGGAKSVKQIKNAILQYTNAVGTVARNQKFAKLKPIAPKEEILKTQRLHQEQIALADEMKELDRTNKEYTGETININGVEKTVYNSEGNRIAKSEKALRAFYNWFGDSKVVDEKGRPRVMYHGSLWEFDTFKTSVIDFSTSWKFARNYAEQKSFEGGLDRSPIVYECYLRSENPFDFKNKDHLNKLKESLGNKDIKVYGNPKTVDEFVSDLSGVAPTRSIKYDSFDSDSVKSWDEIKIGYGYSQYNDNVLPYKSSVAREEIFFKNDEYFLASNIKDSLYFKEHSFDDDHYELDMSKEEIFEKIQEKLKETTFDEDNRAEVVIPVKYKKAHRFDYGRNYMNPENVDWKKGVKDIEFRIYKVDNPDNAKTSDSFDNWLYFESAHIEDEKRTEFLDYLQGLGYDAFYMQEKGVLNIGVFSPNQIKSVDNRGTFDPNNPNIYYQMVGEKSQTADLNKLSEAKRLHEQGASNEEIRQKTGWFLAKDEKWRYEISDKDSKINDAGLKELEAEGIVKLKDLLIDDNLFNAYPNLKNMSVTKRFIGQALALFNGNGIVLAEYMHDKKTIRSVLKHELQHAIQQIESFAKGGSPEMFSSIEDLRKDFDFYNRMLQKSNKYLEQAEDLGWGDNAIIPELSVDDIHYTVKDAKKWKKEAEEKLGELQKEIDNYETPLEKYKKLLGEVEAREVQNRLDMTDKQRMSWKNKPVHSIDYLKDQYIAVMQDGSVFYHVDSNKSKYLVNGDNKVFDTLKDIHEKAGLIENAPEKFTGKTKSDIKKHLNIGENGVLHIQSPIEKIKIQDEHLNHLVNDNEPQRKTFLNYMVATIERPNIIVNKGKKNNYFKFFVDNSKVKPHLQIVKVVDDGSFYVTNYRPTKQQVNKTIKEGQVIYDLSNIRIKGNSLNDSSTISQSDENVNSDGKLYQKAYVSMKGELVGDYLDADEFAGTGEGAMVHGWGNYLLKDRKKNKVYYYDWMSQDKIYYKGSEVGKEDDLSIRFAAREFAYSESIDEAKKEIEKGLDNTKGGVEKVKEQIKEIAERWGVSQEEIELLKQLKDVRDSFYELSIIDSSGTKLTQQELESKLSENAKRSANLFYSAFENLDIYTRRYNAYKEALELDLNEFEKKKTGAQYEAEVPENKYLLDEDKFFNKQPEVVRDAINEIAQEMGNRFNEAKLRKLTNDTYKGSSSENWKTYYGKKAFFLGKQRALEYIHNDQEGTLEQELTDFINNLDFNDISDSVDFNNYTGREIYQELYEYYGSKKSASKLLEKHGVKGIKYDGERDGIGYVIFKGADAQITRRLLQRAFAEGELGIEGSVWQSKEDNKGKVVKGYYDQVKKSIGLTKHADFSTLPHEFAHFWFDNMWSHVQSGDASPEYVERFKAVQKFVGLKDGEIPTAEHHEKFARAYEKRLLTGAVPNSKVATVFDEYEEWIRKVYENEAEVDERVGAEYQPLTEEMYEFFSTMVSSPLPRPKHLEESETLNAKENEKLEVAAATIEQDRNDALEKQAEEYSDFTPVETVGSGYLTTPVQSEGKTSPLRAHNKLTGSELEAGAINMEYEIERATEFVKANPKLAEQIVNGLAEHPKGYVKNTIYIAYNNMQERLGNTKNVAASVLNQALELHALGQEIATQRLVYGVDPVNIVNDVIRKRTDKIAKQNKKKTGKEITDIVDKETRRMVAEGRSAEDIVKKLSKDLAVKPVEAKPLPKNEDAQTFNNVLKYVKERLGMGMSLEEATNIVRITQDMNNNLKNARSKTGNPTLDYFEKMKELDKYAQSLAPSSNLKIVLDIIMPGNLLAGIKTTGTNIVSTFPTALFKTATRRLHLGLQKSVVDPQIEAMARKEAMDIYLKTGYHIFSMDSVLKGDFNVLGEELTRTSGKGFIRAWGRLYEKLIYHYSLGVPDVYFKNRAFVDYASLMATKMANGNKQKATEMFRDACLVEPKTQDGKEIRKQAREEALVVTYQNQSVTSETALKLRSALDRWLGIGKVVEPFVKTPANLVESSLRVSVGGVYALTNETVRAIRRGGFASMTPENKRLISENMFGVLIALALAASIDEEDYMPAYALASSKDRQLAKELNIPYNSIRFGDTWYSLDYIGVLAAPLVSVLQAKKEESLYNQMFGFVKGSALQAATLPGLGAVSDLVKTFDEVLRKSGDDFTKDATIGMIDDIYARAVPMLLTDIAKALDPYEREREGLGIQQNIPILREELPKKVSVTSGRAEKLGNPFFDLLAGARVKEGIRNSVADELKRLNDAGYGVSLTRVTDRGKLSEVDEQTKKYVLRDYAEMYAERVGELIETEEYQELEDGDKSSAIGKIRRTILKELRETYL